MGIRQSTQQLPLAERRYRISPTCRKARSRSSSRPTASASPSKRKRNGARNNEEEKDDTSPEALDRNAPKRHSCSNGEIGKLSAQLASMSTNEPSGSSSRKLKPIVNKRQRSLIMISWRKASRCGSEHVGSKMFLKVLMAEPNAKSIFGLQNVPQARLKYDPRFRSHAIVFLKSFDFIIKNLSQTEKLEQHFVNLGRKHAVLQSRGFIAQYWDTFAECMTQAAIEWEGGTRCRETLNAWRHLVAHIVTQMRCGFDQEKASRRPRANTVSKENLVTGSISFPNGIAAYAANGQLRSSHLDISNSQFLTVDNAVQESPSLSMSTPTTDSAPVGAITFQCHRFYDIDCDSLSAEGTFS